MRSFLLLSLLIFSINSNSQRNSFELNPDSEYFDHLRTERQRGVWDSVEGEMNLSANDWGSISSIHLATSKAGSFIRNTMFLMDSTKKFIGINERWSTELYSPSKIDLVFDTSIGNFFSEFGDPKETYTNQTIKILGVDVFFENGYKWDLTFNGQPAVVYIGYEIEKEEIKNRKGQVRRVKETRVGTKLTVPKSSKKLTDAQIQSSNSVNNSEKVGKGFFRAYQNSSINRYLDSETSFVPKNDFEIMTNSSVFFGNEDDDSPNNYYKSLVVIGSVFYELDMSSFTDRVNFTFTSLDPGVIAIASKMGDNCEANIIIDIEQWNSSNYFEKLFIMMHELGHDLFNLKHSDGLRIMSTNKYELSNPEDLGEIIHEMFYHIKSSVDESTYLCSQNN